MPQTSTPPSRWYNVYRNDEEKCVFVGKDGCSGLIRATDKATGKKFEWRSTDMLAKESGLSKKRVEEILEYYCNKKVVRQHAKDPEKWGYWELVGSEKDDPDVVARDHEIRMEKQQVTNGKIPSKPTLPSSNNGQSSAPSQGGNGKHMNPAISPKTNPPITITPPGGPGKPRTPAKAPVKAP